MRHSLKNILSFITCIVFILTAGCQTSSRKQNQNTTKQETDATAGFTIPQCNLLTDSLLPQYVDFKQRIDHLSYQELRILRSYPYALHGYWFMEGDLNSFFCNKTNWYYDLCEKIELEAYENKQPYADTYEKVKLTPTEQAFIKRIDQRMEQLSAQKYHTDYGVKLLNPNLCVNLFQIDNPEPQFMNLMHRHNFAMAPTAYEQLFNIYENNDYRQIPSFITTDVFLQAFHMYFSYVLKSLEKNHFSPTLRHALYALHAKCMDMSRHEAIKQEAAYAATFFAIAYRLLTDKDLPIPPSLSEQYKAELQHIMAYEDDFPVLMDDKSAYFPYSLFKPRGHYTHDESFSRYFRSMMWLQTASFCRENTRPLWNAIVMASALNSIPDEIRKDFDGINKAITFLMGEPDNASIPEIALFLKTHHLDGAVEYHDENVLLQVNAMLKKLFTTRNRIAPKIQITCTDKINFMPQRYTADNEILSTMTDVTPGSRRPYPMGLDVFAAFGVKSAESLLDTCFHEAKKWNEYVSCAQKMKKQFCKKDNSLPTMYNHWMETLVEMQHAAPKQPAFMHTPAWKCKNLQTALASWTELKHDAVLYAKQPLAAECGGGGLPEPVFVGYVEPNLRFWNMMKQLLAHNRQILQSAGFLDNDLEEKTARLEQHTDFCLRVTEKELRGEVLTSEEYRDIQKMGSTLEWFTLSVIEPGENYSSWHDIKGTERSVALVSDVYTRNVPGCHLNGILHEATGLADAIYVLVEINGLSYITCGAAFSYYEFTRPLGERLTDEAWQQMLKDRKGPSRPQWIQPYFLGKELETDEAVFYNSGC